MTPAPPRSAFPVLARLAYLNAGTCGPVAAASVEAAADAWRFAAEHGRTTAFFDRWSAARDRLRIAYAAELRSDPSQVALTSSTSEGVVRVLRGLGLGRGHQILIATGEHPGLAGPVATLRDADDVEVAEAPLRDLAEAITPATTLVACSHVSWRTGELAPLEALRRRPPGVRLLLDGAQGVGAVDFAVGDLGCDFYAGSGQKWLCGPMGLGMLWLAEPCAVAPLGATYPNLADAAAGLPHADARRHDTFVHDLPTLEAALAALGVLGGRERLGRAATLADDLATELGDRAVPRDATTLVAWESGGDPVAGRKRLAASGVIVRDLPGTPWLRASVGPWNDRSDLERLLAVA